MSEYRLPDLNELPGWVLNLAEAVPVSDVMKLVQTCPAIERIAWCSKARSYYRSENNLVYIPSRRVKPDHWILRALGEEMTLQVMRVAGGAHTSLGVTRTLYSAPRLRWMMDLAAYGWSNKEIAAAVGVSIRYASSVNGAVTMWLEGSVIEAAALANKISSRLFTLALAYDWLRPIHTPAMIGKIGPPRLPPATACHDKQEQAAACRRRYSLDLLELGFTPDVAGERAGISVFEVMRLCQAAAAWRTGASLEDVACLASLSEDRTAWLFSREW